MIGLIPEPVWNLETSSTQIKGKVNNFMADSGDRVRGGRKEERRTLKPVLDTSVLKAFVAGVVVASLNKNLLLGFVIGALGGTYIQQNFSGVPDVVDTWRSLVARWRSSRGR